MITGKMMLPDLDGVEISPGIFLIGKPTAIEGTTKLRCLADVGGALCIVELNVAFPKSEKLPDIPDCLITRLKKEIGA